MPGLDPHDIAHKTEVALSMTDLATSGELNEKQLDAFKSIIIDKAPLLADGYFASIKQKKMKWEYAGFPSKISYPVDENEELVDTKYSKLTTIKIPFDCTDMRGAIPLSDTAMRNNLMKGMLAQFILNEAAPRVALDMEDYGMDSDTTRVDDLDYAKFDGIIKQAKTYGATNHTLLSPVSAVDVNDQLFYYLRLALPKKHWRDLPNMRYYCSPNTEAAYQYYRKSHTAEAGYAYGEQNMIGRIMFDGVPLFPVPNMPDDTVILTHRMNIVWAIELGVEWELEREAKKARYLYHVRYSFDVKFAVRDAFSIHDNVKVLALPTT